MKFQKLFLLFVLITLNSYGQYNVNYTTELYNSTVNTNDNTTKLKLFDIEYNGEKIPVNIYYSHTGIKVDEQPSSLGMHWKIGNIGIIKSTINHLNDNANVLRNGIEYKGWFNSLNPDYYNDNKILTTCADFYCPSFTSSMATLDLSPDFFSVHLANANNFDFLFKKNIVNGIIGTPIPAFLSNPDGYKINTNFNNFNYIPLTPLNPLDLNVVFNILDKNGNKYDFFKGNLIDMSISYCDYYLKSITNSSNQDFVNINYIPITASCDKSITTGRTYTNAYNGISQANSCENDVSNNLDYDDNVVRYYSTNLFTVSENRLDLKKINTNKVSVDFIYTIDNQNLDEISITDFNGNYISGYKFIYQNLEGTTTKTLFQIKKYNSDKTQQELIYEFEYNYGAEIDIFQANKDNQLEQKQQFMDYFGYYNHSSAVANFLPLTLRGLPYDQGNVCDLYTSKDFQPNLFAAKCYTLLSIKNKFSGKTIFDYQLNQSLDNIYYGGGLLISSIKKEPIVGVPSLVNFTYENPSGFFLKLSNPDFQFISATYTSPAQQYGSINIFEHKYKFYSSIPKLYNLPIVYLGDGNLLYTPQVSGNFFNRITENNFDFNTMLQQSSIVKEYVSNYEGIYRTPVINSQTFKNTTNQVVKKINYNNTFTYTESIARCELKINGVGGWITSSNNFLGIAEKHFAGFDLNRVYLNSIEESTYSISGEITINTHLNYINADSRIIRSKTSINSLGENIEERYYYANDLPLEPLATDLVTANIIGVPLKTETYKGTEKLAETKTVYAKDATTSNLLLPKYVYSKKGTDLNSSLEKQITFDQYDDKGNLQQYTQENGTSVYIIWGYNKTKPIVKIESLVSLNISQTTIANLQTLSNADNDHCTSNPCTGNEETLRLAINAFRASYPDAMITTYTYDPLIGLTSITDPKGDIQYYNYDTFGRLKSVKDKNGNTLSETQYHYKP